MELERTIQLDTRVVLEKFEKALETNDSVFFVDFEEGDLNSSVILYKKKDGVLNIISDNIFACIALEEEMSRIGSEEDLKNEIYYSETFKENFIPWLEEQ